MLAILFSMVHAWVAWRLFVWGPQVPILPTSNAGRLLFMIYWGPPFLLLNPVAAAAGAPPGTTTGLMLLPLAWLTCFVYGWLTAIAICLPFRLKRRR